MIYYKNYKLTIIETDGKYTLYDTKYGSSIDYLHMNIEEMIGK